MYLPCINRSVSNRNIKGTSVVGGNQSAIVTCIYAIILYPNGKLQTHGIQGSVLRSRELEPHFCRVIPAGFLGVIYKLHNTSRIASQNKGNDYTLIARVIEVSDEGIADTNGTLTGPWNYRARRTNKQNEKLNWKTWRTNLNRWLIDCCEKAKVQIIVWSDNK